MEFKTADIVRRLNQTRTNRVSTSLELLTINDSILSAARVIIASHPTRRLLPAPQLTVDGLTDKVRAVLFRRQHSGDAIEGALRESRDHILGPALLPSHARPRS